MGTFDCSWCGSPATQFVVQGLRIVWHRCERHKLERSLSGSGCTGGTSGYIGGAVFTNEQDALNFIYVRRVQEG
jgi:hypothetical protein